MTKDIALKLAIEYIENSGGWGNTSKVVIQACKDALELPSVVELNDEYLRDTYVEGLSQPAQTPVAWMHRHAGEITEFNDFQSCQYCEPLYTHPAPVQEPVVLLEVLSDLEHQQWIKWAQSIIDSEPISEARKQRWLTMMVDYKDLPDNIQEYDREWARKVMALYTHPASSWQGLSNDEQSIIFKNQLGHDCSCDPYSFYLAIEQALRNKNGC